jgi:hypothetical protein
MRTDIVGYGRNEDTLERLFIIYDTNGLFYIPDNPLIPADAMAFTPVPRGVIYKFHLESNKPITSVFYYTNTKELVQKASDTSLLDAVSEFWSLLNKIKDNVIGVFWFGYSIAIFMWDNLFLIIPLYLVLTGVLAIQSAKGNPHLRLLVALRNWFGMQRALFQFFMGTWDMIVGLITKILK